MVHLWYDKLHSGKSVTIRESNHASGVYKEHYGLYFVPKRIKHQPAD